MVKKCLAVLLAVIMCITLLPANVSIYAEESNLSVVSTDENIKTGTLGDNNGFQWTYDESTKILTVTGEDTGLCEEQQKSPFSVISLEINKIVFENCKFIGSISCLCKNLTNLNDIKFVNCDMSEVTDMSGLFYHCNNLSSIDLGGLDTGNVTDMSDMFYHCDNLSSIDLSSLDTRNVTDMSYMFYYCVNLGSINVGNWNTGNVADMSYMFSYCSSLSSINVSDWNTQSVTDMSYMFSYCSNLSNIDVENWNTANVTDMSDMFSHCSSLCGIDVGNWDIENVMYMCHMFCYCSSLSSINIMNWNMKNVKDLYWMFEKCKSLDIIYTPIILSEWDVISLPDTYYDTQMNPVTKITSEHSNKILVKNIKQDTGVEIKEQLSNIDLGPYALKGAVIKVAGYEIPLIDIEANVQLNIGEHLKVISDDEENIKVLFGYDKDASANINGANNSTTYWSESYQDVKVMYQDLTGKKVDTTRLWNKFSSLRGKLKKMKAGMVVEVDSSLAGYAEFKFIDGQYVFLEGGIIAEFEANTDLYSYHGPCYVVLGIEVGANGSLSFVYENDKVTPNIFVSPEFTISAGGGIGTKNTHAEIRAYGTLNTIITTIDKETPFRAGLDLGVRWEGYIIGKEIFSDEKSFTNIELYPNFGNEWNVTKILLMSEENVSSTENYNMLINSGQAVDRSYLYMPYVLSSNFENASFSRNNAYPLNGVSLVTFEDNTMLLVWVDDLGEKTTENIGSIMYSYYDGSVWSDPEKIFEDGTANTQPYVYSDGRYAYIVWQKANQIFEYETETSIMLKNFDLYAKVFDSQSLTFTDNICINSEENDVFEFNPVIYGETGNFKVCWVENTDNNVYQMSGVNTLHMSSFDINGNLLDSNEILSGNNIISNAKITDSALYYSLIEDNQLNLYSYTTSNHLVCENIYDFDCVNEEVFYSDAQGFYSINGNVVTTYEKIGSIKDFSIVSNQNELLLFTTQLNEDFTKTLYYSKLLLNEANEQWSEFEVYSNRGLYIRNYSPVVLSDDSVYVAFNYLDENLEENMQLSHIVVEQCTKDVDIQIEYVDFDDSQLETGTLDMEIGIKNNSSANIDSFTIYVVDNNENVVLEKVIEGNLGGFEEGTLSFGYDIPMNYNNEVYSFKVLPTNISDLKESNNIVRTTFECIHAISEEWTIDVKPTSVSNGIKSQHCQKCNQSFNEEEIPYLRFSGASLTLYDNLTINYRVDKNLFEETGYQNPHVKFVFNGKEIIVDEYELVDGKYVFDFDDIAPNQMNDIVYATLYAEYQDYEFASETREYTVADYCYNMLEKYRTDEYAEFRTLLIDLLNYGEASQIYTNYNLDNLVTDSLTDVQKTWGTSDVLEYTSIMDNEYVVIENPKVIWRGAGLNLQDSVTMRFRISTESIDGLSVKINTESKIWIIESSEFKEIQDGYYIYFDKLNAAQMSEPIYLTIYDGEIPVSNTVCYSIESYVYSKQNDTDAKLVNLVNAMMKYGNSAYSYIN